MRIDFPVSRFLKTSEKMRTHITRTFWIPCLVLLLPLWAAVADPWITNLYQERVAITNLNPAVPGSALRDFPVLITVTNASWLDHKLPDGGDLTFAGVDGQQLFHEMEQFDAATRSFTAWVCVPTFTNQTTIYLYWNNGGTQVFSGSNTVVSMTKTLPSLVHGDLASNVWDSNFILVHHFGGGSNAHRDSTRWGNHSTSVDVNVKSNTNGLGFSKGVYSFPQQAKGGIKNTNFQWNPVLSNMALQSIFTATVWFKWDLIPSNSTYLGTNPGTWNNSSPLFALGGQWSIPGTSDRFSLYYNGTNRLTSGIQGVSTTHSSVGHVQDVTTWKNDLGPAANWRFYGLSGGKDSALGNRTFVNCDDQWESYTGTYSTGTYVSTLYLLGTGGNSGSSYRWNPGGAMDEFRLSFVTRSSNWLMTEYSNMVQSTNMGLLNGLNLAGVTYGSNLSVRITNGSNVMVAGAPLRGLHLGSGVTNTVVIFSNATGGEAARRTAVEVSSREWSALLDLSPGSYAVNAVAWDLTGAVASSESLSVRLVTSGTLTVKSLRGNGVPYAGGRIMGPSTVDRGVRTNGQDGISVFSNLLSGFTYTLENYARVPWGMPRDLTNFTMPEGDASLVWVLTDPSDREGALGSGVSNRMNGATFFPGQTVPLTMALTGLKDGAQRVSVVLIPLNGGARRLVYDNLVEPAFPWVQIESEVLRRTQIFGSCVLEVTYHSLSGDVSRDLIQRKMLFLCR